MAVPIPPGKIKALERHITEAVQHEDFEETLTGFGILHESWHIQETPQGDLLILVFESDDPFSMLQEFSRSEKDLPVMQKNFLGKLWALIYLNPLPDHLQD